MGYRKFLYILFFMLCCSLSACQQQKQPRTELQLIDFYQIDPLLATPNPIARFTLVEFFDYRCEACAAAFPAIKELQAVDPQVQVIYRELPFLGPDSEFAARAALASALQSKYSEMHDALMQDSENLNEQTILDIAKKIGLNISTLANDMQSEFVNKQLFENSLLAAKINLQSTPTYLFARTSWHNGQLQIDQAVLLNGAQTVQQLKDTVVNLNA